MIAFKNLSIQSKLTLIIMLTSCIALLAACVAFEQLISYSFRNSLLEGTSRLVEKASILCSAEVVFDRPDEAEATLKKLGSGTEIQAMAIYRQGKLWATYPVNYAPAKLPATVPAEPRDESEACHHL